ncbi:transcription initiation factor IIE, alpha subunit, putative [Plasmodium relictum]|uniref:Transcription initiation factor IIE, alpha subunit, putative n=1 Tax=Plasmodium relictum TaxID=85471 RepID=A0A1J1H1G0_PLARL|nr:transcription initiation factor IIE, alpha subunit, putative [Plasmodium relictum]CRG98621.1 transcription initiation factor IIE, alpha subunit, putative [Plasmodium relictum]
MDKTKEIFYDKEKKFFLYLMIYISRFFMSDEEIVIFDLFVHNECLYLEKDIINSINMNEHKIRSILSKLLRDKFIIEVQKYKNNEKGSNCQTYYCLNNYIVYVIDFRIKQMENEIQKKKNESDIYICNYCNSTYSQLDAQTLPLDSYDAHFLCFCNNKIELIENDDNNDEKIYNKYTKYLNILKEHIEKLKNYFIPLYTEKFNRSNLNSSNSFLSDNSSEGSITNNSSEISLTNNSSLISQIQLNESDENGKRKKEETYTDTCSSVIRKNKKIKICMNVKTKNILRKNLNDDKIKISNIVNDTKEENIVNKNNDAAENNESSEKSNKNTKNITNEQEKEPEFPLFFIQKFNKKFTLIEAQKLQQDMSQEEFENFMELQDIYLDKL